MKVKSRIIRGIILSGILVTVLFSATGSGMAVELLKWTGCGITKKAFMAELAQAYQEKTGVIVSLSGGGATKGIRDTDSDESYMGGTCRPALPETFPAEEGDVEMYLIAWDALVPVVHKNNPVNSLTPQQLKDVLTGKITNWKELGGADKPILVVARTGKISGVGYMARKMIFDDSAVDYSSNALFVKSSGPLENKVSFDELAIGVTGVSSARKRIESGRNLKILKINGIEATKSKIGSGTYPYFRPLYLAVNPKSKNFAKVKKFIDWVLSDEGQAIIDSADTVNLQMGKGLKDKFQHWKATDRIVNFSALP